MGSTRSNRCQSNSNRFKIFKCNSNSNRQGHRTEIVAKMTLASDKKCTTERDILHAKVKEVCNHISNGVPEMKQKHGVWLVMNYLKSQWLKLITILWLILTLYKVTCYQHEALIQFMKCLKKTVNSNYVTCNKNLYQASAMNQTYQRISR